VLARLQGMLASGVIRRVGAVPNHYRLGLRGNGMSVWDVPDERAEELGRAIGALDCVSHCYLRPRHAGIWPYNLFAMLHGADRQVVEVKARRIAHLLGRQCRGHDILFSSAVLKKTGLRLAA
jgi:DNA-binding Lrp family transcriptional regulator